MKKLLLVFAFVAVYGVSMAASNSTPVVSDNAQVTIVADMDDNTAIVLEGKIEKAKDKKAKAKATDAKAKGEGCSEAKAAGCADAKAKECADAPKKECCDSKKK